MNGTGSDSSLYVCGDYRLGPITLPSTIPLDGIAGLGSMYRRFGGSCPGEYLTTWWNASISRWKYPDFDGYTIDTAGKAVRFNYTLREGVYIDRFGDENSNYTAPAGTPYAMRSLPPWNLNTRKPTDLPYNYYVYKVNRTMRVEAGPIAPAFGQPGLGVQFILPKKVLELVNTGNLTRIDLTANPNWAELI